MRNLPRAAFKYGRMALSRILAATELQATDADVIIAAQSPLGLSLTQVVWLANELKMDLQPARRQGEASPLATARSEWMAAGVWRRCSILGSPKRRSSTPKVSQRPGPGLPASGAPASAIRSRPGLPCQTRRAPLWGEQRTRVGFEGSSRDGTTGSTRNSLQCFILRAPWRHRQHIKVAYVHRQPAALCHTVYEALEALALRSSVTAAALIGNVATIEHIATLCWNGSTARRGYLARH